METIIIKKVDDLDGYRDEYGYHVPGHMIVECYLTISGRLLVDGALSIKAGESIEAGGSIEAGEYIFSFQFEVSAKKIITKKLPFWRQYWAAMPPLKKWSDQILAADMCWPDLKKMITRQEAKEVCAWDGWHPLLRAQLEMFFGLKKSHKLGGNNGQHEAVE